MERTFAPLRGTLAGCVLIYIKSTPGPLRIETAALPEEPKLTSKAPRNIMKNGKNGSARGVGPLGEVLSHVLTDSLGQSFEPPRAVPRDTAGHPGLRGASGAQ